VVGLVERLSRMVTRERQALTATAGLSPLPSIRPTGESAAVFVGTHTRKILC